MTTLLSDLKVNNIFENQPIIKTAGDPVNTIWTISQKSSDIIEVIGYTQVEQEMKKTHGVNYFYKGSKEYDYYYETLRIARKMGAMN
ncbi:hypothetical protein CMI40_02120 [Candidatus Pacearchaeota archaeon]|jgi:hypothetical protein|nr:hypothetical protein [Candidatus Pacearchaeota archaeon]|tara:strand:- start:12536 stop:12796 length:261 start_codon:yes stop_codon:yes gene_type:complete